MLLGAWIINRIVRRVIRRFVQRVEGSAESGRLHRLRARTPSIFLHTGEVNLRAVARAQTVGTVLRSIASGIIYLHAAFAILPIPPRNSPADPPFSLQR